MSRRRISSARRLSRGRRSSGVPGDLEENSDVFDKGKLQTLKDMLCFDYLYSTLGIRTTE